MGLFTDIMEGNWEVDNSGESGLDWGKYDDTKKLRGVFE
jgi:hypothetical protein